MLDRRQLDVDPLTQVFSAVLNLPLRKHDCWEYVTKGPPSYTTAKRTFLFVQRHGRNFPDYKPVKPVCGVKRCINPWHASRHGKPHPRQPVPIQYPDIADRERLLLWYAAGNSPIRALDVDDVKAILEAAPDALRSYKGRKGVPRR